MPGFDNIFGLPAVAKENTYDNYGPSRLDSTLALKRAGQLGIMDPFIQRGIDIHDQYNGGDIPGAGWVLPGGRAFGRENFDQGQLIPQLLSVLDPTIQASHVLGLPWVRLLMQPDHTALDYKGSPGGMLTPPSSPPIQNPPMPTGYSSPLPGMDMGSILRALQMIPPGIFTPSQPLPGSR